MLRRSDAGFTQGRWGFRETWPEGSTTPVFDVCLGKSKIAEVAYVHGEWRMATLRPADPTTDFMSYHQVIELIGNRVRAIESAREGDQASPAGG